MSAPVTIVGAGTVGRALGTNLLAHGHRVRFAVRRPEDAAVPDGATVVAVSEAGEGADVVILAVPFGTLADVVPALGLAARTVLVDATNPFGAPTPEGYESGARWVESLAGDGVAVVKAFNVLGAEHMTDPPLSDGSRPVLPVAGDDADARRRVADLAAELGFDAVEVGSLDAAGLMEEAARYWGLLAFAGGRTRNVVLVAHQRPTAESA